MSEELEALLRRVLAAYPRRQGVAFEEWTLAVTARLAEVCRRYAGSHDYEDMRKFQRKFIEADHDLRSVRAEYYALAAEVRKVATMFTCTDPTCPCGGAPVIEFEEAHISEAELPAFAKVLKDE